MYNSQWNRQKLGAKPSSNILIRGNGKLNSANVTRANDTERSQILQEWAQPVVMLIEDLHNVPVGAKVREVHADFVGAQGSESIGAGGEGSLDFGVERGSEDSWSYGEDGAQGVVKLNGGGRHLLLLKLFWSRGSSCFSLAHKVVGICTIDFFPEPHSLHIHHQTLPGSLGSQWIRIVKVPLGSILPLEDVRLRSSGSQEDLADFSGFVKGFNVVVLHFWVDWGKFHRFWGAERLGFVVGERGAGEVGGEVVAVAVVVVRAGIWKSCYLINYFRNDKLSIGFLKVKFGGVWAEIR